MMRKINNLLLAYKVPRDFILDLLFPRRCVGCGKYGEFVCFDCAGKVEKIKTPTCASCGRITKIGEYCSSCKRRQKTDLDGIIYSAGYDSVTKELIHNLKYNGVIELSELLGELIYLRIKDHLPKGEIITVPVPLHQKRKGARGFNQSELICRYLSDKLGLHGGNALSRVKETVQQVKLSGEKRRKNLEGAFICEDGQLIFGKIIFLVDDVSTTGTTLEECAKILKFNGAKKVFGVVVARRV